MNKISLLITLILFSYMSQAQQNSDSYESLWKNVQKFENEALTKSALKVVAVISKKAQTEKNSVQIAKSLIYSSKFALTFEEDAQLKIINGFKSEIEKTEFPTKNVLESYLANLYWQFFQENRYQFYERTKTESKVDSIDFRTWDLTTLFQEISIHFEKSLEKSTELQKVNVRDFKEILNTQPNSEIFRPTLFDLLAHTALQFYTSSENNISTPANKFEINSPEILCEALQYSQYKFDNIDKTSQQEKALELYKKLIQFYISDPQLDALADVDIERLKYIYQNAVFSNKDLIYLETLQNSAENYKNHEVYALYKYEIALLYHQQGNTYQPITNAEPLWKQKEAMEICDSAIALFPKSKGADKCKDLKSQILSQSLQLTTEKYIPINTYGRLLVNYKNQEGLELTARKITQSELESLNNLYPQSKQLAFIQKMPVVKKWDVALRNDKDFQTHSTEILLPPLNNDHYLILATPKESKNNSFAYSPLYVTNMAVIETRTRVNQNFQVLNRQNGLPISGASVKITYQVNYDRGFHTKTLVSDKNGIVSIALSDSYWNNVKLMVSHEGDVAYFGEYYINKNYDYSSPDTNFSCFLFTDRSIYRPGQPLYFKGIAMKSSKSTSSVLDNTEVTVVLRDVNYQEVGKQIFRTNAFGSFSGEFMLPNNGLNGNFTMEATSTEVVLSGSTDFSVDEYKRPKFETSFEPVKETYKVNGAIKVIGAARAYSGSNITDAKVLYTVRRVVYFPRWYAWRSPYFNSTPQEIANGETTTNESGNYEIDFIAIPDNTVDPKKLPTFNYEVTADVTDINGETHSASTTIQVGYHSLTAEVYIPNPVDKDKEDTKLTLLTNNLNGQFVPAAGTLKMYKLKAPERVFRNRPWNAPDFEGFKNEEFTKLYPHDAFSNEDDPSNWEKGKLVWETNFDTEKSKEIVLPNTKRWLSGKYIIELETKDKFGQIVKDISQTTLFSDSDKQLSDNQLFQIKSNKISYSIGERAEITILSSSKDLTVTVFVEKDRKIIDTHLIHLSNNSESFSVPVDEKDLGGFAISYSFSAYNSFNSGNISISVPYPKTDLEIETVTFRDKLQPGTDETWSFKIKGAKGEKVAAELLASMYDASLDAFRGHYWSFYPINRPNYYSNNYTNAQESFGNSSFSVYLANTTNYIYEPQYFDTFDWFGFYFGYGNLTKGYASGISKRMKSEAPMAVMGAMEESESLDEVVMTGTTESKVDSAFQNEKNKETDKDQKDKPTDFGAVSIRKNLQETAFFFPQLQTDKDGNVSFNFTTPEALTKWKLQLLAYTKNLESSVRTLETVTQKELMVMPNAPRFMREGDEITISNKISNLSSKVLSGLAKIELIDALSGLEITNELLVSDRTQGIARGEQVLDRISFQVDSLGNTQVSWRLKIPEGLQAVQYKILAKAGDFSDGEQNILPVLTNRMLVTETLPMWVRSNQSKTFVLNKFKSSTSNTLKNHKLTLEITSNPAWYAVQALPYLMEFPYECNEQTFARYYANSLASHIASSNPRIQEVFKQWSNSNALVSNLEKNEELKSILIQETPWLRDAQSETEQKKRIALLFNLDKMKSEQGIALNKLQNNQKSSGAWAWFNGGPDNRFITQHIVTGLGHLQKLTLTTLGEKQQMIQNSLAFLDTEFIKEYEDMKKYASNINDDHLSDMQLHYMYMRSFYSDIKTSKKVDEIMAYYKGQIFKFWTKRSLYSKGMMALFLYRSKDSSTSNKILKSLKENSITSEELGMYWKENTASWYWHQAPIETQALMIEAFSEIQNDSKTIDNLKIWLLKNKQTSQWKSTKATTEAVYALLLQGSDWLSVTDAVEVLVGGEKIEPSKLENVKIEAGTGYFKTSWNGPEVDSKMAEVQISKKGEGIAWGSLYWQYFEDLDKITTAETPLKLKKKLFLKKNTASGEEISEVGSKTKLKVGDLVRMRIELRSDRDMEFVHMKDMRAAGFEPINVFSQYKWQDGLGYYESTKDASTNFFFDYLPKGVYIFEYDLRVNNAGEFSNGITTIQSMYAPEFSSHSEGARVLVN